MLFGAILMAALAAAPPAVPPEAAASDEKFERELVEGVPAPLRFGRLAPVVGRSVEFQVSAPKSKARVLAALTRRVEKDGKAEFQYEFDFTDAEARTLVVVWVSDEEKPSVTRVAVWAPPQPPVSVPLGVFLGTAQARGVLSTSAPSAITGGPFAGAAVRAVYRTSSSRTAEVTETSRVPLFGVQSVKLGDEQWVAVAEGSGAQTRLLAVPLVVPRMPRLLPAASAPDAGGAAP
jgi:hypothetical protein